MCLGPGRWVREEPARARLTSAAAAAGRVAPSGQWGNGKECGGFKQNSMSLPGCCQTAGLPRSPARPAPRTVGEGGSSRLLYPLNLFSSVSWVPQCSVQPLWEASASKERKCSSTFGIGLYKYPLRMFSLWSSEQVQRWRGDGIPEHENPYLVSQLVPEKESWKN